MHPSEILAEVIIRQRANSDSECVRGKQVDPISVISLVNVGHCGGIEARVLVVAAQIRWQKDQNSDDRHQSKAGETEFHKLQVGQHVDAVGLEDLVICESEDRLDPIPIS